jgi:hypothetical protein
MKKYVATLCVFVLMQATPATSASAGPRRNHHQASEPAAKFVSLELARDDNGKPAERVDNYRPTDGPMHFVVSVDRSVKGTTVRVVLTAVDVATGDKDLEVGSLEATIHPPNKQTDAQFIIPQDWPLGEYRVDVYLNGEYAASRTLRVTDK